MIVLIPDPIEQNQIKTLSHLHFHVFGLEISSIGEHPKREGNSNSNPPLC